MGPLCELRGVRRSFPVRGQDLDVLRGIDLDVSEGDRTGISGASGAGKSTLLAILGLIDDAFEGAYRYRGTDVRGVSSAERGRWRLREIGFAFQDLYLLPSLTAAENVALPALAGGRTEEAALSRAQELLDAAGLGPRSEHRPNQLSGGERRRVAFARALVNRPRLFLLDEPTADLDADSVRGVLNLIDHSVREGAAFVAATHDSRLLSQCRRLFHLVEGRLVESDEATALPLAEAGPRPNVF